MASPYDGPPSGGTGVDERFEGSGGGGLHAGHDALVRVHRERRCGVAESVAEHF